MRRLLARWRVSHLVGSWLAYWLALGAVTLWPAAVAISRVSRPGVKGDASASLGDGILHLTVNAGGSSIWSGSISVLALSLLVALPPIAIWLLWLRAAAPEYSIGADPEAMVLGEGDPSQAWASTRSHREKSRSGNP